MDKKSLARVEIKDETKGEVEAVFATLGVKDHDNDVTRAGAFEEGAQCVISAYGHKSWEGALPVGMGTIHEVGNTVVMKGHFFMDTTHGRDTFNTVKALGSKGEWSYGFNVDDSEDGDHEGKSVRFLKKMTVHEVSPVLRGAGIGTHTTSAKGFKTLNEEISGAVAAAKDAIESAERVVALRAEKGSELSKVNVKSLEELDALLTQLKTLTSTTEDNTGDAAQDELNSIFLGMLADDLNEEE